MSKIQDKLDKATGALLSVGEARQDCPKHKTPDLKRRFVLRLNRKGKPRIEKR